MGLPAMTAHFSFVAEEFDLDRVTQMMGLSPTSKAFRRLIYSDSGENYETHWELSTKKIRAWDVNDCLRALLEKIIPQKQAILTINQEYDMTTKVSVDIDISDGDMPALCLGYPLVQFLNDIQGTFEIDIH